MKNSKFLLIFIFLLFCSESTNNTPIQTETSSTSTTIKALQTTTTTEYIDQNIITSFEDAPLGAVRIVVDGAQVSLNDNFEFVSSNFSSSGSGFFISSDGLLLQRNQAIFQQYAQMQNQ